MRQWDGETVGGVIAPPAVVGVVGGGQLGRMLAFSAHRHGYRVAVLTGGAERTPAGAAADVEIAAPFDEAAALERFIAEVDVVTWELEDVDLGLAEMADEAGVPVRPGPAVIAAASDRWLEKKALISAGVPVAPHREVSDPAGLAAAVSAFDSPVIVKTARSGYDGKGQIRLGRPGGAGAAGGAGRPGGAGAAGGAGRSGGSGAAGGAERFRRMFDGLVGGRAEQRLIVEQEVPFDREVSVVVARAADGAVSDHGVMENTHPNRILDTTVTPASLPSSVAAEASRIAARLAAHLDVIGVLCVEMFVVGSDLIVNEMAPRPHNSGHLTIEAAAASQFDQQLRAVCGLPLGDGSCRPAAMVQLLGDLWGDGEPAWGEALADPAVRLHLYGKEEVRPGRKMGHLTCVDSSPERALRRALAARARLGA